ncbi:MAG: ubiquinol-cytochrome c reductase iron-sulfur subunit [Planctomycetota bacterium]
MAIVDDLHQPLSEAEAARRRFLLSLGGGALTVAGLGTLVTGGSYLRPNVLFEPATRFAVGRPGEIPIGEVLSLPRRRLFVVRSEQGYFAMSAVCTHLGCMVRHQEEDGSPQAFFCPCHGSRFDKQGNVIGGPAPRPLRRLELTVEGGELVVDVRRIMPEGTVTET